MPEISRFFGMVITMYYNDHEPAHFHVRYGATRAVIGIDPPTVIVGDLPRRALSLIMEWAELYRDALMDDWQLARSQQPLQPIDPLE